MYYLIYISSSVKPLQPAELTEMLTISRRKNAENNVSGILLYADCTFIQVLEGKEEDVKATYYTIIQDGRHKNIVKLSTGCMEKRAFPDWYMGFVSVDPEKLSELKGYIDPDSLNFDNLALQHPTINILKTFVESNYQTQLF